LPEWQRRNKRALKNLFSLSDYADFKNDFADFSLVSMPFNLCNRLIIGVIRDLKEEDRKR